MKRLEPTTTTTTVAFFGDAVHKTIANNPDMLNAVWKLCSGMLDATIKVHVNPRITDSEPVVWGLDISSPTGRRSIAATQRRTAGNVIFTNQ